MDELAAAAVVVSMAKDGFANHDLQQRSACGTVGADNAATADAETTTEDKETHLGDAATGDPEDAALKVSVTLLLPKAEHMFPEGAGGPRAFGKDGTAAKMTNELLENAVTAVFALWKRRGYDPKKPEETKARLGYALDRYEAAAYLVTGAAHLPLLSQPEAWTIGKRIMNIIGESGAVGKKLKPLRKRGRAAAPQTAELLKAPAALNLELPPRKVAKTVAAPPPAVVPPLVPAPPLPLAPTRSLSVVSAAVCQQLMKKSEEAGRAIAMARQYDRYLGDLDSRREHEAGGGENAWEDYDEDELDMARIRYRKALRELSHACP